MRLIGITLNIKRYNFERPDVLKAKALRLTMLDHLLKSGLQTKSNSYTRESTYILQWDLKRTKTYM